MKSITEHFKCGKCNHGIVTRKLQETKKNVEITMRKCDNCKYQYGVKEVNELEIISEAGND